MRKIRRFDKAKFDPYNDPADKRSLEFLRNAGWGRRCAYREFCDIKAGNVLKYGKGGALLTMENSHYDKKRLTLEKLRSTAYNALVNYAKGHGAVVDAGCGKSPDAAIAVEQDGFRKAYRLDLFEFSKYNLIPKVEDHIADVSKKVSAIKTGSVDGVISQAVLDLMDAKDRDLFYREARRWLKKGGILSVYIVNLSLGYGFNISDERETVEGLGFEMVKTFNAGFVARKK